jgi:ornithine cyclodeaminase
VITATTSNQPVLPDQSDLLKGKCFITIGSYKPDMRELPDALFPLCDQVFMDTEFAAEESGDLAIPLQKKLIQKEQIFTLGKRLKADPRIKKSNSETNLFKSVGMALFDVVVAHMLYEKAKQKELGTEVVF